MNVRIFRYLYIAAAATMILSGLDSCNTVPELSDTATAEIKADIVLSGLAGQYGLELPETANISSADVEGDFMYLTKTDGAYSLVYEQNDEDCPRKGLLTVRHKDGSGRTYTVMQRTAAAESADDRKATYTHSFALGYGYNAIEGAYCEIGDIRGQILNVARIIEMSENGQIPDIIIEDNTPQRQSVSKTSSDYLTLMQKSDFNADGMADVLIFRGQSQKVQAIANTEITDVVYTYASKDIRLSFREIDLEAVSFRDDRILFTDSFCKSVTKLAQDMTDENIDIFLSKWGTHIVVSAVIGGKLELLTKAATTLFSDYYMEQSFASVSLEALFNDTSAKDKYNWDEHQKESIESTMSVYGGDLSYLNSAILNPSYKNTGLTMSMLTDWENSLKFTADRIEPDDNAALTEIGVMPVWELLSEDYPDLALRIQNRAEETAMSLLDMYGDQNYLSTQFGYEYPSLTCRLGGTGRTFEDPAMVNIIAADRYVASICKEWIPEISENETVTVVYPIYDRILNMRAGLCIRNGMEYTVDWRDGKAHVTEKGPASGGSVIYMNDGALSTWPDNSADYVPAHPVIGYEWPGSIDINGNLTDRKFYLVNKFLDRFYLNDGSANMKNLPNWTYSTSSPSIHEDYAGYLTDDRPYELSHMTYQPGKGISNLSYRMIRNKNYQYYLNKTEISYE